MIPFKNGRGNRFPFFGIRTSPKMDIAIYCVLTSPLLLFRSGSKNVYILVSGAARRLLRAETRREAFDSMQRLADIVGPRQFHSYIDKESCSMWSIISGIWSIIDILWSIIRNSICWNHAGAFGFDHC